MAELSRHEQHNEQVKEDILEIKLAQTKLSLEVNNLDKTLRDLNETIKKSSDALTEAKKQVEEQKVDIKMLKFKFALLACGMGLFGGAASPLMKVMLELVMKLFAA